MPLVTDMCATKKDNIILKNLNLSICFKIQDGFVFSMCNYFRFKIKIYF